MKTKLSILVILIALTYSAKSQQNDSITKQSQLVFELPIFDLPYQFDASKTVNDGNVNIGGILKGYANPSMHQSLSLSTDLYTALHFGVDNVFHFNISNDLRINSLLNRLANVTVLYGVDFLSLYAPGFDGWEHEEYHRAVMTRFHVNSFNDMNKFPIGAETVSVNSITDEDLIRFKKESSANFVRMHAAGIEGEYLLNDKLQSNNFFYNQELLHEYIYWLTTLNSIMYVNICSIPNQADPLTNEMNLIEKNILQRDFTGLDFTAWTYDLFHPDEAYTERGVHPSGIGVDRYIKTTDLSSAELSYLKKQGRLQWLNLFSPMMIGIRRIKLTNDGWYGNFSVRDFLTSFGNDISINILLKKHNKNIQFNLHNYFNYQNYFPAIEAKMIDVKTPIGSNNLILSPRILLGLQPQNQEFKTNKAAFVGLAECKVELQTKGIIRPYAELSLKTKGWVAGNEFLDDNFSFRFGIISRIAK